MHVYFIIYAIFMLRQFQKGKRKSKMQNKHKAKVAKNFPSLGREMDTYMSMKHRIS